LGVRVIASLISETLLIGWLQVRHHYLLPAQEYNTRYEMPIGPAFSVRDPMPVQGPGGYSAAGRQYGMGPTYAHSFSFSPRRHGHGL
jgi:hypothetical protein